MNNVVAAADCTTLFLGALYSLDVLPLVSVERAVYYRERSAFFYNSWPFSLAQCTVELPYIAVQAVVYSCIVYWCCGFEADAGKQSHLVQRLSCYLAKIPTTHLQLHVPSCADELLKQRM